MAEQVVTEYILKLEQYEAQIAVAIAKMEEYVKETTDANKSNKDLSGSAGSAAGKVKELGVASDKAGKGMKDVNKAANDLGKELGNTINEVTGLGGAFGRLGGAAVKLGRAITVALGPVGIAIAAVVAGIALLVKAFFGTQEGADKLAKVTAVLGTVFDRLLGVAQTLGKAIFDTFSNPKQAVSDLWEAIKTNLSNRLEGFIDQWKALGDVIAGVFTLDTDRITAGVTDFGNATVQVLTGVEDLAGKVANGFNNLADEIGKAADTGARIADIDRELRKLALERAQNEGAINRELQEQLALVQDVTKSAAERAAAGDRFKQLQKELTGFEQRRLDLEIERGNLAASTSDTLDEEKIRIAGLVSAKEQALADEAAATRRVSNTLNGLNKAAADKAIAEAKRVTEERVKAEQEALDAVIARVKAQDDLDLQLSNRRAALLKGDLEALRSAQNDELLLRVAGGEEINAVLADQGAQREAILKQIQEAEIGALLAKFDAEFESAEKAGIDTAALVATQEAELAAFKAQERDADLENLKVYYEQQADLAQQQIDAERELSLAKLDAAQAGADILGKIAGENEQAAALALAAQKAAAIAQIVIQTAAAVQSALAAAALNPAVAALGPAAIAAFAAPTIAKLKIGAGINIATILAQSIKGAYEGGVVGENSVGTKVHNGRDGYISMVHKGERILSAKKSKHYEPYLQMMEGGQFDTWLASMRNVTAYGNGERTRVAGFNDKRLVGALGGVGSVGEQRKQTELLASLNHRLGRRGNKRYRVA